MHSLYHRRSDPDVIELPRQGSHVIFHGWSHGSHHGHVHECCRNEINRNWQSQEIDCHCAKERLEEDYEHGQRVCFFWGILCALLVHDIACKCMDM